MSPWWAVHELGDTRAEPVKHARRPSAMRLAQRQAVALLSCAALVACGNTDSGAAGLAGQWRDVNGQRLASDRIEVTAGPEHCQWEGVTFLRLAWPVTSDARPRRFLTYVRDPDGAVDSQPSLSKTFRRQQPLPTNATDTGYRHDETALFLASADGGNEAYLRFASRDLVEVWPLAKAPVACD
ncbi:MAG: hypothetical protein JWN57_608 [Frankiales bacterium]|nr:hypothetical protein [Frankiales bacterium]